jgi:hypothetical protein
LILRAKWQKMVSGGDVMLKGMSASPSPGVHFRTGKSNLKMPSTKSFQEKGSAIYYVMGRQVWNRRRSRNK